MAGLVRQFLETQIAEIAEKEIQKAVESAKLGIDRRVKELLPQVATGMLDRFRIERPYGGPELVIRIDISENPKVK